MRKRGKGFSSGLKTPDRVQFHVLMPAAKNKGPMSWRHRIRQVASHWTNNTWRVIEDLKFVSDPMLFGRHMAELNATNSVLVNTYVWGLDLSSTLDGGAGGMHGVMWGYQRTGSGAGARFCANGGNGV